MEVVVTLCPHCNMPLPITHLVLSLSFFPLFSHLNHHGSPLYSSQLSFQHTSNTQRGESDPNEPPKKQNTRQSKGGSDDECKVENTVNIKRSGRRAATRMTKAQYVFLSLFSFFLLSLLLFFLLTVIFFVIVKPPSPKTRRLRHSQVVVNPSLG